MAQLDSLTYSSQVIWTVMMFFCLYMYLTVYFFPMVYRFVRLSRFVVSRLVTQMYSFSQLGELIHYSLYWWLLGLGSILCSYSCSFRKFFEIKFSFFVSTVWLYFYAYLWLSVNFSGVKCSLMA